MKTLLRLLSLAGYAVGCVACGWCAADLLGKALDTTGVWGHVLAWLSGLYTLGVLVNARGFCGMLPGNKLECNR